MNRLLPFLFLFLIATKVSAADPTPPDRYEPLIEESTQGAGFVVQHQDKLWGVCAFDAARAQTPSRLVRLLSSPVALDSNGAIHQPSVQAIPVNGMHDAVPFLAYKPEFALAEGEELLVLCASRTVTGKLSGKGLDGKPYQSTSGPMTLEMRMDEPFPAAGGIGGPVLLKKGGAVVGVITSVDDARNARIVNFETLYLPAAKPVRIDLLEPLRPTLKHLPKRNGWELEPMQVDRRDFGWGMMFLDPNENKKVIPAIRQMAGFAGSDRKAEEVISLTVVEFADAAIAKTMPDKLSDGYREGVHLIRLAGGRISRINVYSPMTLKADASKVIRVQGIDTDGKTPFSNVQLRAARGHFLLELTMRNLDFSDANLAIMGTAVLDAIEMAEAARRK